MEGRPAEGSIGGSPEPLGRTERGRLDLRSHVRELVVTADSAMKGLYEARFEGLRPEEDVHGGVVRIRYPHRHQPGRRAEIVLNARIPWEVDVRGGVSELRAELRQLSGLVSFAMDGGANRVLLSLPGPSGAVPVRLSGGANKVEVLRPSGAAARVRVSGGAGRLEFDGRRFGGTDGETTRKTPGFGSASDRYEVEVSGGFNEVRVGVR